MYDFSCFGIVLLGIFIDFLLIQKYKIICKITSEIHNAESKNPLLSQTAEAYFSDFYILTMNITFI